MHTKKDILSECLPQAFVYLTDPTLFGCHCHGKPNLRTGRNEVELVDTYFARCIIKVKNIESQIITDWVSIARGGCTAHNALIESI